MPSSEVSIAYVLRSSLKARYMIDPYPGGRRGSVQQGQCQLTSTSRCYTAKPMAAWRARNLRKAFAMNRLDTNTPCSGCRSSCLLRSRAALTHPLTASVQVLLWVQRERRSFRRREVKRRIQRSRGGLKLGPLAAWPWRERGSSSRTGSCNWVDSQIPNTPVVTEGRLVWLEQTLQSRSMRLHTSACMFDDLNVGRKRRSLQNNA